MTPEEYVQLKAFARQDGALLSLLWIGALICYIQGFSNPLLSMAAIVLVIISPFYAANRLKHFRDEARQGIISFKRAYAYCVLTFFYAGLLLAAALYVYFAFIDKGYLMGKLLEITGSEHGRQALQMYGMTEDIKQALKELAAMRPIDYALNMLTVNIMTGFLMGIPIAALMQRKMAGSKT